MKRPRRQRMDIGLRKWIYRTARKNYWRIPPWMDLDDLIQEGYICYAKCRQRYPLHLTNAHFMALVKVTYTRAIHDLANMRTRQVDVQFDYDEYKFKTLESAIESHLPPEPEDQTFYTLLQQLSEEMKQLIDILLTDARNIPYRKMCDRTFESRNSYLCRLIKVDPEKLDIQALLRNHFLGMPYVK